MHDDARQTNKLLIWCVAAHSSNKLFVGLELESEYAPLVPTAIKSKAIRPKSEDRDA